MRITCSHGGSRNLDALPGSRIRFYRDDGSLYDSFCVPKHDGVRYCERYAGGQYGRRYFANVRALDAEEGR